MSMYWKKCLAGVAGFALSFSLLAQTRVEYIHTDALGSPVAVTDAVGNVVEREFYEPYGSPITRPPSDQPGFTGHVSDSLTNLTYMQQRYYDPQIGRFLSVDPVTAYSNPVGAFNRYWYANNNPYKFTDPDGRQSCESGSMKCRPSIASSVRTIGPVGNVSSAGGKSSTPSSSARSEPSTQSISSNGAFSHYKEGSGKPLRMGFNDIDTSGVKVVDFPQVKALISGEANGSFGIDSRLPFSTSGDQALFLGNITLRLQGSLSLSPKSYAFSGTLKSFDDTYDFNKSTHRGWIGEALTRWGAGQPGVPYEIQIRGSKVINEAGDR